MEAHGSKGPAEPGLGLRGAVTLANGGEGVALVQTLLYFWLMTQWVV